MCSRHLGADMVIRLAHGRDRRHGRRTARPTSSTARRSTRPPTPPPSGKEKIEEYKEHFANPYKAASRGYVDDVILPSETRSRLIDALETMRGKRELRPPKKHGNIPM